MTKQKFTMPDGEIVEKEFPIFKTPYNHDTNFESDRTGLYCKDPSRTKQEFREQADINHIIAQFLRTREPPPIVLPEHFVDISDRPTYFDMHIKLAEANEAFYLLPASKRYEFLNDPTRWADAVVQATDRGDKKALADLGINVPPEKPQETPKADPLPGGTPAPGSQQAASAAPKAGDTPAPPTETPKK